MFSRKRRNYNSLKRLSRKLGIDAFGSADIRDNKQGFLFSPETVSCFHYALSMGVALSEGILAEINDEPTRLYFHHYKTVNMFLDQAAVRLSVFIQSRGYRALPVPASQIIDWQDQKGQLSHKHVAVRAGLGWIGRNNLLVHARFGSRLRLVSVLTDMPLAADLPSAGSCGACMLCVDRCPAHAIQLEQSAFDHRACYEKLKEFQKRRLVDQYICGVCVASCLKKS